MWRCDKWKANVCSCRHTHLRISHITQCVSCVIIPHGSNLHTTTDEWDGPRLGVQSLEGVVHSSYDASNKHNHLDLYFDSHSSNYHILNHVGTGNSFTEETSNRRQWWLVTRLSAERIIIGWCASWPYHTGRHITCVEGWPTEYLQRDVPVGTIHLTINTQR